MRRLAILMLVLLPVFMGCWMHVSAQPAWWLWAYEPVSGRLLRVDNGGNVLNATNILSSLDSLPVVAPDGITAALLTDGAQTLVIRDLVSADVRHNHNINNGRLHITQGGWQSDSTQFAFVEMQDSAGWAIHLIDFAQGNLKSLQFGDEITLPFPQLNGGVVPNILSMRGDAITFNISAGYQPQKHSYTWFTAGNILAENLAAPTILGDALPPAGEFVHPIYDNRYPANNEDFRRDFMQRNTVHIYDTDTMGRYPVFHDPLLDFRQAQYIQGGQRVLVDSYENVLYDWWLVIDRNGNEVRRLPIAGFDVWGTPQGFIYATEVGSQTAIVTVDSINFPNVGSTLWIERGDWRIVHATLTPQNRFNPWLPLDETYPDPSGVPVINATPTVMPPFPHFRRVGMAIQIYTLDDDYLNLRDRPSTDSNVLALLESGTRGVITDGPVEAEGYVWWQIQVSSRRGWVVESLPDVLTLIPPQNITKPTETPTPTTSP